MKNNKVLIIIAAAILIVGLLVFSLEKLHVVNLYQKPAVAIASQPPRPVNTVDYTPQTSPPDPTINSEKNPSQPADNTNSATTVSVTRANQDPTTKNLNVGVLVDGVKTGTCKLELLQGSAVVFTDTANITEQSGLTTCAGFTILASNLPPAGSYTLKISVGKASATQNVELKK